MKESDIIKWIDELPQTTGVFARNAKWAKNAYTELKSLIPASTIQTAVCYDGIIGIRFKSGKTIRFVLPYEEFKGMRFHRIYIDAETSGDLYSSIIRTAISGMPYVILCVTDMIQGGIPACNYYTAKWIISSDGYYPYCSVCGKELLPHIIKEAERAGIAQLPSVCPYCGRHMK